MFGRMFTESSTKKTETNTHVSCQATELGERIVWLVARIILFCAFDRHQVLGVRLEIDRLLRAKDSVSTR